MTNLIFISHEFFKGTFKGEALVRSIALDGNGKSLVFATYCDEETWKERGEAGVEKWIEGNVNYGLVDNSRKVV